MERIAAEEGCQAEVRSATSWPPVAMFEGYVAALSRVCERSGRPWRLLDSGAGHDAEILASHVPAGMLFVPSHDGVSHSPLERTDDRLLVQGCQALADSVLEILGPEPPS
ncbi:MAG: M20/M25/M40 family metallo-hydrolase [Chloroflexi bacterium]|nr:MAG: M20/M25/M40 family metallo-hydrolase [Chloroflexota bacterium]